MRLMTDTISTQENACVKTQNQRIVGF